MFHLILKTLWTRRRRNAWLLAELILVAVLSWAIFDPVIVVTHDRMLPLGYDADRLCLVSMDALQPSAPGYDSSSAEPGALMESYLHIIDRVRQHTGQKATQHRTVPTSMLSSSCPTPISSRPTASAPARA